MGKQIKPTDAIVDDIALYLGRQYLVPRTPGVITYPPRADTMDAWRIVSAVLSHPDARGLFADEDDRPWEPLSKGDPLNVGDEVRQDVQGTTRTGIVGRVGGNGEVRTAEHGYIGVLDLGTWYVRRAVRELPKSGPSVIVPADGHRDIEALLDGIVWSANEAVLGPDNRWHGVWRSDSGWAVISSVAPEHITPDTWKVDDQ